MKLSKDGLLYKFFCFSYGSWLAFLLGIVTTPIITRLFLPAEYGRVAIFNVFVNLLNATIFLGLDQSYNRYFYKVESEQRANLLYNCVIIPLVITVAFCIIFVAFRQPVLHLLFNEYSLTVLVFVILKISFIVLYRFSFQVVRMNQHGNTYSILNIFEKSLYLIIVIVLSYSFRSYKVIIISLTLASLITAVIGIFVEKKQWKRPKRIFDGTIVELPELIRFGAPLTIYFIVFWVFQSVDKIFIQRYWGYGELGIYSGAFLFVTILSVIQTTFSSFWVPVAYDKFEHDPNAKDFFIKINTLVSFSSIIAGIIIITIKDIAVLLLGESYRSAVYVMPFLLFVPLMYTISETTVNGINFANKSKAHIYISVACCAVNIIGNFILVKNLGAKGAAISTGLSYILFLILRTQIANKYYAVNFHTKEMYTSISILSFLALYSTFNQFCITSMLLSFCGLTVVVFIYFNKLWMYVKTS